MIAEAKIKMKMKLEGSSKIDVDLDQFSISWGMGEICGCWRQITSGDEEELGRRCEGIPQRNRRK